MRKFNIVENVMKGVHRAGFMTRKHRPEILVIAGVAGVVTSAVMACRATTKLSGILEASKCAIDDIHYAAEHPEELKSELPRIFRSYICRPA